MKKRILIIVGIILFLIIIIGGIILSNYKKEYSKSISEITINVYNKDNNIIYNKNVKTEKLYLIEALKDHDDLNLITEPSQYGEYIISIMGIEQGDNYYWSYYVNEQYATTGVSNCKIEDGDKYDFKIEKFE